jgi:hypothetical protein
MGKTKTTTKTKTTRARGPVPERTARVRYVEPATTKDGNPFFALRVPADLLRAFKSYAKHKGQSPTVCARSLMAAVTGYELEDGGAE